MSSEQPEIVEEVHNTASSLEEQTQQLHEFREYIEEASGRVTEMESSEREAFYEKAADLRSQIDDIENVDMLLELEDDIEEAIRSPLRQAALNALDDFLTVVEPELSDGTKSDIHDQIKSSVPADLEEITTTYKDLTPRVTELPPQLRDIVAESIENHPSHLANPNPALASHVDQVETRLESLEKFETMLDEAGSWAPDIEFTTTSRFYIDLDHAVAKGQIQKHINSIDTRVKEMSDAGLNVTNMVQQDLDNQLSDAEIDEIASAFSEIDSGLATLVSTYENVNEYADAIEQFGTDRGIFETQIDDLLATYEQLQLVNHVSALQEELTGLQSEFSGFFDTIVDRLNAQREMVADLQDRIEKIDPPEVDFAPDRKTPITKSAVRDDLHNALEACATYDSWVEEAFNELGEALDTDEATEIWRSLYDGERVRLTEDNQDTILALADRFSIDVVLGSE